MSDEKQQEQQIQQLIITFKDHGSAIFKIDPIGGWYPSQLFAVAAQLEYMARQALVQDHYTKLEQLEQEERLKNQIVTPNKGIAIGKLDEQSLSS